MLFLFLFFFEEGMKRKEVGRWRGVGRPGWDRLSLGRIKKKIGF